jgi:hypothetical protein
VLSFYWIVVVSGFDWIASDRRSIERGRRKALGK